MGWTRPLDRADNRLWLVQSKAALHQILESGKKFIGGIRDLLEGVSISSTPHLAAFSHDIEEALGNRRSEGRRLCRSPGRAESGPHAHI